MPVENVNTIKNLNEFYPASTDPVLEGDDHLRLIKTVLKTCFPNIDGAVTTTHTEINDSVANTKSITAYSKTLLAKADAATWRDTLGLNSAAQYPHWAFAPVSHGHVVSEVEGAVSQLRNVTANTGVGVKRPGDASWSTILDLSANLEVGLRDSGAAPGTYGSATKVPRITVDSQGRVTSVSQVNVATGDGGGTIAYDEPNNLNEVGTYCTINETLFRNQFAGAPATGRTVTFSAGDNFKPSGSSSSYWNSPITGQWKFMGLSGTEVVLDGSGQNPTAYHKLWIALKIAN